jgi:hypothetical protein
MSELMVRRVEGVQMADPPRLRSNSGSLEAILLASSRSVEPPPFAEEEIWRRLQTLSTIGVAAGTAAVLTHRVASASSTLISKTFWLSALKWGAVVAVGAPAVGVAVHQGLVMLKPAVSAPAGEKSLRRTPPPALDVVPQAALEDRSAPDAVDLAASRSVRATSKPAMNTSSLTVESDMLAAARAKLAGGDPRGALAEITRLGSQFPRGRLLQEREVVAIDSLEALGDNEGARARSTAFLRLFPGSPYAAHLRRILEP